ncbi:Outer membrane protein assembly factor BamB, contains PQQ-like beta-propeller repeat [Halogranum amylolyticum]|uniref:Outer membrane protein assembly factor BamB, contains PQQ-like beta-propeller repeat n=1 Tax=Halogranum amylolyticum TaxID=660520 RepID=A0A1H8TP93_9EURY|nr:aryl-sulfate sulfotransferase [Halogranum amylolyticum]SEO92849.1 Outer membrane protein assembly factor BamB, contains PQQ-like beta-propeller repeat [Halogranum amylolyticum]
MRTRLSVLCLVVLLVGTAVLPAVTAQSDDADAPGICQATATESPETMTVVSVQGAKFDGEDAGKKPARLVGVGADGAVKWVQQSGANQGVTWGYDVDPLENGNVFVTATMNKGTVVYELDPQTGETLWSERLDTHDTHDVDLLSNGNLVVADMRNYNESTGENEDRVFVYNRTTDEVVWEWQFDDHYGPEVGGNYSDDWTHVNDVDPVGDDQYLLSPRNFDQVVLVNRTTGNIDLQLGSDGDHDVLRKQHNPDYLESEDGTPTFLVADSENDRIVEYERTADGWNRTWRVGNSSVFDWPRDADRLESGNTLVTDSKNHRVVEVTPDGEVVWEFYSPWLVYDATRLQVPESGGPTMADLNASERVTLKNGTPRENADLTDCDEALTNFENSYWQENRENASTSTATDGDSGGEDISTSIVEDENDGLTGVTSDLDSFVVGAAALLLGLGAAALRTRD